MGCCAFLCGAGSGVPAFARLSSWAVPDDVCVIFAELVAIEGEAPAGQVVLRPTGGPYLLEDGWCDQLDA